LRTGFVKQSDGRRDCVGSVNSHDAHAATGDRGHRDILPRVQPRLAHALTLRCAWHCYPPGGRTQRTAAARKRAHQSRCVHQKGFFIKKAAAAKRGKGREL
jgi:hypothetical protein